MFKKYPSTDPSRLSQNSEEYRYDSEFKEAHNGKAFADIYALDKEVRY